MDPDRFVFGLHSFYNALSSKIRKKDLLAGTAQFVGLFHKLRYTKSLQMPHINRSVVIAYTTLVMELLDYLRPKKLDLSQALVGVTTDGGAITVQEKFADTNYIFGLKQIENLRIKGETAPDFEQKLLEYGRRLGLQGDWTEICDTVGRVHRRFQNYQAALLPLINEYTFDIFPEKMWDGNAKDLLLLKFTDFQYEDLENRLLIRRRTLPTNGAIVKFSDPTETIEQLLLKEIVYEDKVFLLFRLRFDLGDTSGYYIPSEKFFCTITSEGDIHKNKNLTQVLETLILYCYGSFVLDDDQLKIEEIDKHFRNFVYDISAEAFGQGGRLKQTYGSESPSSGERKESGKYVPKEHFVNGYIRRLPEGQTASEEAQNRAKRLGYELALNETYVSPFVKTVWALKEDDELNKTMPYPHISPEDRQE